MPDLRDVGIRSDGHSEHLREDELHTGGVSFSRFFHLADVHPCEIVKGVAVENGTSRFRFPKCAMQNVYFVHFESVIVDELLRGELCHVANEVKPGAPAGGLSHTILNPRRNGRIQGGAGIFL